MNFRKQIRSAVLVLSGLALVCCSSIEPLFGPEFQGFFPFSSEQGYRQAPQYAYAGEVLSYMMQVVLGREGQPANRSQWALRGSDVSLDLNAIRQLMAHSEHSKAGLMVYDANILGLSGVLYHYNSRLNQFKGKYRFESVYPSSELLAVRLLLLKKIQRAEKIQLNTLLNRPDLLLGEAAMPTPGDLEAIGLQAAELKLLRDILREEPQFWGYLQYPHIVRALYRLGVVDEDPFVAEVIRDADQPGYECRPSAAFSGHEIVTISILPSLIDTFDFGPDQKGLNRHGFKPTRFYQQMVIKLQEYIIAQAAVLLAAKAPPAMGQPPEFWQTIIADRVSFCVEDERPLVIYPHNADRVIEALSPKADLNIILLGKDVYLAIHFDPRRDIFPGTNRLYIDIMDVKHALIDDQALQIGEFILSKITPHLHPAWMAETPGGAVQPSNLRNSLSSSSLEF